MPQFLFTKECFQFYIFSMVTIPVIDFSDWPIDREKIASKIRSACLEHGFFYLAGHGIDLDLQRRLETVSHRFFNLSMDEKMELAMSYAGHAWRGYFPVGGELTSGKPDQKEGIYLGTELGPDDVRVQAKRPMHGANLFPLQIPEFGETTLSYMSAVRRLGHTVMEAIAQSLNLEPHYFENKYLQDPLILFRIFHYPPVSDEDDVWGVGEHTDYGLLTLLKQDHTGGLQVKSKGGWIDAPPITNTFICNIGDMLDLMTGGLYRSTPHRVLNTSGENRYSFPLFFDPGFDCVMERIAHLPVQDEEHQRWDQQSLQAFGGTYGEYILNKVGKVFPQLLESSISKSK